MLINEAWSISQLFMLALVRSAPVKSAPLRVDESINASVKSAPTQAASVKSMLNILASVKSTLLISAPDKSAKRKFAPLRFASDKSAPLRSLLMRFALGPINRVCPLITMFDDQFP